jgi:hypothetical protein
MSSSRFAVGVVFAAYAEESFWTAGLGAHAHATAEKRHAHNVRVRADKRGSGLAGFGRPTTRTRPLKNDMRTTCARAHWPAGSELGPAMSAPPMRTRTRLTKNDMRTTCARAR